MRSILLTGANGFIGKNIQKSLGRKYKLILLTKESTYDINSIESLLEINNIDVVIHAAAKTFVPDSFDNPYEYYKFNVNSTLNIAEFCRVKGVKKVIYLNSYMYGVPEYLPVDEEHPVSFHSPYNKSKYISENIICHYLEGVSEVVSLRLFNVYGEYQNDNFLIPLIIKQVMKDKAIYVQDLEPKRDFIYIKDVMSLIDKVINVDQSGGIYNVANGHSYSVDNVIDTITEILAFDVGVSSSGKRRKGEVMNCFAKIDKVKQTFNWTPKYDLKSGLKDYIETIAI